VSVWSAWVAGFLGVGFLWGSIELGLAWLGRIARVDKDQDNGAL
jgi:hypothetical protein